MPDEKNVSKGLVYTPIGDPWQMTLEEARRAVGLAEANQMYLIEEQNRETHRLEERIAYLETTLRTISAMPTIPGINPDGTVSTYPMHVTLAIDALNAGAEGESS